METQLSTTFCFFLLLFSFSNGLFLVGGGEDKRQGLIPFPRVGRNSWLQSSPYFRPITDDLDDTIGPDDFFPVRFSRSLFAPRLGRRKRSSEEPSNEKTMDMDTKGSSGGGGGGYYDAQGNAVDLNDFLRRSPWAIFAYKDGIEKKMAFNPRLGRAMAPRLGRKRSEEMADDIKRSPTAFSPRLGRASFLDDSGDGSASSGGDDETPLMVSNRAFNPRLGRSKSGNGLSGYTAIRGGRAFSPRLGRSDVTNAANNNNEEKEQPNQ